MALRLKHLRKFRGRYYQNNVWRVQSPRGSLVTLNWHSGCVCYPDVWRVVYRLDDAEVDSRFREFTTVHDALRFVEQLFADVAA